MDIYSMLHKQQTAVEYSIYGIIQGGIYFVIIFGSHDWNNHVTDAACLSIHPLSISIYPLQEIKTHIFLFI